MPAEATLAAAAARRALLDQLPVIPQYEKPKVLGRRVEALERQLKKATVLRTNLHGDAVGSPAEKAAKESVRAVLQEMKQIKRELERVQNRSVSSAVAGDAGRQACEDVRRLGEERLQKRARDLCLTKIRAIGGENLRELRKSGTIDRTAEKVYELAIGYLKEQLRSGL